MIDFFSVIISAELWWTFACVRLKTRSYSAAEVFYIFNHSRLDPIGHAVLGVKIDEVESCQGTSVSRFCRVTPWPPALIIVKAKKRCRSLIRTRLPSSSSRSYQPKWQHHQLFSTNHDGVEKLFTIAAIFILSPHHFYNEHLCSETNMKYSTWDFIGNMVQHNCIFDAFSSAFSLMKSLILELAYCLFF